MRKLTNAGYTLQDYNKGSWSKRKKLTSLYRLASKDYNSYVALDEARNELVFDKLAMIAEKRAYDILKEEYFVM